MIWEMWLNQAESPWKQGIPQGGTLGTILFNLFVSPLGGICWAQGIKFAGYADDTQNYMSFRPLTNSLEPQITCISKLELCLADVRSWMQVNFLKLNESKTEFIIFWYQTTTELSWNNQNQDR